MIMLTRISNTDQTVGLNLVLECQVTIVMGITSTVDVVWTENGAELNRTNNVTFPAASSSLLSSTDTFTISPLRTSDDGRMIECVAVINTNPSVNGSGSIPLGPTGMYMCVSIRSL